MDWEVISVDATGQVDDAGHVMFQRELPRKRNGEDTDNRRVKFRDLAHAHKVGDKTSDHDLRHILKEHNLEVEHLPVLQVRRVLGCSA